MYGNFQVEGCNFLNSENGIFCQSCNQDKKWHDINLLILAFYGDFPGANTPLRGISWIRIMCF